LCSCVPACNVKVGYLLSGDPLMSRRLLASTAAGSLLTLLAVSVFPVWPAYASGGWEVVVSSHTLWGLVDDVRRSSGWLSFSYWGFSFLQAVVLLVLGRWLGAGYALLFPVRWRLTEDEVIALAKRVAAESGWTWLGPGVAWRAGKLTRLLYAGGDTVWCVKSHAGLGCNVEVLIRDKDSRVLLKGFDPR
jgi:hypothetical protein